MAARGALPRRIPARLVDAERRLRRDSRDAQAVVADGSDDPRYFSAVAIAVHRRDGVAEHGVNAADTALEVRVRGVHAGIDEGHVGPLALADALRECGIDFGKTPLELHVGIVVAHALGLPGVQ